MGWPCHLPRNDSSDEAPEPAGMCLRCSPQPPAHSLRVCHWGKGVRKTQKLHPELTTKPSCRDGSLEQQTLTQGHRKPETNSRALWRGSGVGLGSGGGWVESSLFGHTSLAQAPAPLAQGLVISPAWLPGQGRKPEDLPSALGDC